jgi:hypothetical protein
MIALLLVGCPDAPTPDDDLPDPAHSAGSEAHTGAPPPTVTIEVGTIPAVPTGGWVGVQVDPPTPVEVTCAVGDDEWVAERPAAAAHEVRWLGLLLGATYTCTARAGEAVASATLAIPPGPPDLPAPVVTGATEGYTLFNVVVDGTTPRVVVIDPAGRVRWYLDLTGDPNVGVEASFLESTPRGPRFLIGGGEGWPPSLVDLEGAVEWSAPPAASGERYHHDTIWLPEVPEVLGLAGADNTWGGVPYQGFSLEVIPAWGDERTWSWNSQTAVDAGQLPPMTDHVDAYHANALQWVPDDPDGPSFVVSAKRLHQLVRIDRATGAVTWRLGVGGDFALLEPDGSPADPLRWFYGQHGAKVSVRDPVRGVWDVWLHDNGFDRPTAEPPSSRVLHLEVDVPARTARIAWEWTEPGWYEPVFGDVDLLPAGRVLVTMGHCPQCGAAPRDRRTTYVELDVATGAERWRAELSDPSYSGYRADRIAACDLFPEHRTYCAPGR